MHETARIYPTFVMHQWCPLQRFHCGFLKDMLSSTKNTSTINFSSLNFTIMEIVGEKVWFGGQNSGILSEHSF